MQPKNTMEDVVGVIERCQAIIRTHDPRAHVRAEATILNNELNWFVYSHSEVLTVQNHKRETIGGMARDVFFAEKLFLNGLRNPSGQGCPHRGASAVL